MSAVKGVNKETGRKTLGKNERLCGRRLTETLFSEGSRSLSAYPLRVVFREKPDIPVGEALFLVSVSKRRFKRAVCRNRVKRQVREAYRRNKHILHALEAMSAETAPCGLMIAFLWSSGELCASHLVESKVKNLLYRIVESYT
ncbi:MAG: ribonuclease P protein component [Clostridium sp.]|nr:ribonuclease P protein component [Clostridium sp.]